MSHAQSIFLKKQTAYYEELLIKSNKSASASWWKQLFLSVTWTTMACFIELYAQMAHSVPLNQERFLYGA